MHPAESLLIVCLCAEWCGTCREYRAAFEELRRALPGHRWRWLDVEDEAELAGDIDIETFPSLLIARGAEVLFAGPVLPRAAEAQRLVSAIVEALQTGRRPAPLVLLPEQLEAFGALARRLDAEAAGG